MINDKFLFVLGGNLVEFLQLETGISLYDCKYRWT